MSAADFLRRGIFAGNRPGPARDEKARAWQSGLRIRQRLRLAPLFLSLALADAVGRAVRRAKPSRNLPPWRDGISVIIPERDSPSLLHKALESLYPALQLLGEPHQVIVVVNGAALDSYAEIAAKYPRLEWMHHRAPLGFSAAICKGLERAKHDWTFLMNNDMTLDAASLRELCALRAAEVFAIACQIHQQSATGRREETGFIDWYKHDGGVQVFHADPGDEEAAGRIYVPAAAPVCFGRRPCALMRGTVAATTRSTGKTLSGVSGRNRTD